MGVDLGRFAGGAALELLHLRTHVSQHISHSLLSSCATHVVPELLVLIRILESLGPGSAQLGTGGFLRG
jgi:hypothetical protein